MRTITISLLFLFMCLSLNGQEQTKYYIDLFHSSAQFNVTFMNVAKVTGSFNVFTGNFLLDEKNVENSSMEALLVVNSIDTNNKMRDEDLIENFFHAKKYPTISLKSTSFTKNREGYLATGKLTMHGVTKEIQIPIQVVGTVKDTTQTRKNGNELGLVLNRIKIKRSSFGITRFSKGISDDVHITIFLRLREPNLKKKTLENRLKEITISEKKKALLVGMYQSKKDGDSIRVLNSDLGIYLHKTVKGETSYFYKLIPYDENKFYTRDNLFIVQFLHNELQITKSDGKQEKYTKK